MEEEICTDVTGILLSSNSVSRKSLCINFLGEKKVINSLADLFDPNLKNFFLEG